MTITSQIPSSTPNIFWQRSDLAKLSSSRSLWRAMHLKDKRVSREVGRSLVYDTWSCTASPRELFLFLTFSKEELDKLEVYEHQCQHQHQRRDKELRRWHQTVHPPTQPLPPLLKQREWPTILWRTKNTESQKNWTKDTVNAKSPIQVRTEIDLNVVDDFSPESPRDIDALFNDVDDDMFYDLRKENLRRHAMRRNVNLKLLKKHSLPFDSLGRCGSCTISFGSERFFVEL